MSPTPMKPAAPSMVAAGHLPNAYAALLRRRAKACTPAPDAAPCGPPGLDLEHHPHGLFAHVALRAHAFADPKGCVALLRSDPVAVIGGAWRRARQLFPQAALREAFDPLEAAVTPWDSKGLRGAIIALPAVHCPMAVDFVAVARRADPVRSASEPNVALYAVSERLISTGGALTSRVGRWSPGKTRADDLYEPMGPGVPWTQLIFEERLRRALARNMDATSPLDQSPP